MLIVYNSFLKLFGYQKSRIISYLKIQLANFFKINIFIYKYKIKYYIFILNKIDGFLMFFSIF